MALCWCGCFESLHKPDAARNLEATKEQIQEHVLERKVLQLSFETHIQFYIFSTASCVSAHSSSTGFGNDSTGLRPWWGGLLLASWIAHETPKSFEGVHVLELGCGSFGLPSIVASIQGACVTATDACQTHVDQVRSTLARNSPALQACSSRQFAWEDGVTGGDRGAWDMVIFADVLYHEGAAAVLAKTIASLLRPGGAVIGTVGLHRLASSEIFSEMREYNFVVEEIHISDVVLSTASEASACLNKASMFDSIRSSVESTSFARNECILVRWTQRAFAVLPESDASELLRQKVLNAPYAADSHVNDVAWVPTE